MGVARIGFCFVLVACAEASPPEISLFVSDYRANAIVRYDTAGELIDVFAAGAEQRVDRPVNVKRGPDGLLYSVGFGQGDINRYDLASGAMADTFYWDTRMLEEPVELEFRGEHLFVLGNDTKNLVEIDGGGGFVRELGYPTMRGAQDFVIDGDFAYVATESHPTLGSAIQVWNLATGNLDRHFATYGEIAFASGLTLHDGVLLVSDLERGTIVRFDAATGASLGALVEGTLLPVEIDIGPDGRLYVLDLKGLRRFDLATGAKIDQLIRVADGVLDRPLGFSFVTD